MADQMIPTPWVVVPGGERFRGVAEDVLIVGNRHFAHDDNGDDPPCPCNCDGDRDDCICREGCGWVSTAVALVFGNPTAGDIPKVTASEIVRRVNAFPALLAACELLNRKVYVGGRLSAGPADVAVLRAAIAAATTGETP